MSGVLQQHGQRVGTQDRQHLAHFRDHLNLALDMPVRFVETSFVQTFAPVISRSSMAGPRGARALRADWSMCKFISFLRSHYRVRIIALRAIVLDRGRSSPRRGRGGRTHMSPKPQHASIAASANLCRASASPRPPKARKLAGMGHGLAPAHIASPDTKQFTDAFTAISIRGSSVTPAQVDLVQTGYRSIRGLVFAKIGFESRGNCFTLGFSSSTRRFGHSSTPTFPNRAASSRRMITTAVHACIDIPRCVRPCVLWAPATLAMGGTRPSTV